MHVHVRRMLHACTHARESASGCSSRSLTSSWRALGAPLGAPPPPPTRLPCDDVGPETVAVAVGFLAAGVVVVYEEEPLSEAADHCGAVGGDGRAEEEEPHRECRERLPNTVAGDVHGCCALGDVRS